MGDVGLVAQTMRLGYIGNGMWSTQGSMFPVRLSVSFVTNKERVANVEKAGVLVPHNKFINEFAT